MTRNAPKGPMVKMCHELLKTIPNSQFFFRQGFALKKIIPAAIKKGFTAMIVVSADRKWVPNDLKIIYLPGGPTDRDVNFFIFRFSQISQSIFQCAIFSEIANCAKFAIRKFYNFEICAKFAIFSQFARSSQFAISKSQNAESRKSQIAKKSQ